MKAWTLTSFYLWKDIWSRWLETPGAVIARVLVASLLTGLMLLVHAGFELTEQSLDARIQRMGAQTLVVSEVVSGNHHRLPTLGKLLGPIGKTADIISLRQAPITARDEFGQDYVALVYGAESLPSLVPLINADATVHLINPNLPENVPALITLDGMDYPAITVQVPTWLERISNGRAVVLVSDDLEPNWLNSGYFETTILIERHATPGSFRRLASAVRALLYLEQRDRAQIQSPEALLDELDKLQAIQHRAQAGAALAGGLVVALVFGSIAILEYRQNRYVTTLLRSFGAPTILLLARYTVEALFITVASVLLARWGLLLAHAPLFQLTGFEPALLDRHVYDPYTWDQTWDQSRWLLLGALLSMLPITLGLQRPIGRVLQ